MELSEVKAEFEKFYDSSPAKGNEHILSPENIKSSMYAAYIAGYNLMQEEALQLFKK